MIKYNYLSQFIGNYTGWGKDVTCLIHFKIYIVAFLIPRPKKLKLLLSQNSYIVEQQRIWNIDEILCLVSA